MSLQRRAEIELHLTKCRTCSKITSEIKKSEGAVPDPPARKRRRRKRY